MLLEDLKRDPDAYYRSIAAVLGVEAERFASTLRGKRENVSISQAYLSFWQTFGPLVPRRVTRKLALRMSRFQGRSARVRLKAAHREALEAITCEGNRQLAAEFGLDFAGHGYFM